jgi:hypothetical protein
MHAASNPAPAVYTVRLMFIFFVLFFLFVVLPW